MTTPDVMEAVRAVAGLRERLARGIHVLDVGRDGGDSTLTLAAAFPRSRFLAIEPDPAAVERARRLTTERRLRNVYWLRAAAPALAPLPTHDLVCAVDAVHDTADRRAALRAIHAALADDGLYLWSVPPASDADRSVRALAREAGFSRVDALPGDEGPNGFFALRK